MKGEVSLGEGLRVMTIDWGSRWIHPETSLGSEVGQREHSSLSAPVRAREPGGRRMRLGWRFRGVLLIIW